LRLEALKITTPRAYVLHFKGFVVVIDLTVNENIEIRNTEPNSLVRAGHHHMPTKRLSDPYS